MSSESDNVLKRVYCWFVNSILGSHNYHLINFHISLKEVSFFSLSFEKILERNCSCKIHDTLKICL